MLTVTGSMAVIDLGARPGISKGTELSVMRVEEIKDTKGQVVWSGKREVGTLRVVEVQEDRALTLRVRGV